MTMKHRGAQDRVYRPSGRCDDERASRLACAGQRAIGRRRLGVRPDLLLTALTFGAALVVVLWWHDTSTITSFGDWLTNAGRVTGLLAGYVIVVLLLLMARVPALERGLGADRLARWHSMGGRYTISLSVAHTLLIIWGYAVTAHESLVGQTGALLTKYPDVMMATAALGLLVLVAAVSMRAARSRLRYETWYYLHFYTYIAIALSFSHEFATGLDFSSNQSARVGLEPVLPRGSSDVGVVSLRGPDSRDRAASHGGRGRVSRSTGHLLRARGRPPS